MANHRRKIEEILDSEGWSYRKTERDILLIASFGAHKWKMNLHCTDEGHVSCWAAYPWPVPENRRSSLLAGLNELNLQQQRGCFLFSPAHGKVLYRCGVQIMDDYTSYEAIRDLLLAGAALTEASWNPVYRLIFGISEEVPHSRLTEEVNHGE